MRRKVEKFDERQRKPVYGPVVSRRLGSSIGINLFPGVNKVCSLDCIYCFLKHEGSADPSKYSMDNIGDELDIFFNKEGHALKNTARFLTFSGNGEPTLHPNFSQIVKDVRSWKEKEAIDLKLAIFTNGTELHESEIQETLLLFDKVFIKFDWCSNEEFQAISRPTSTLAYDDCVAKTKAFVSLAKAKSSSCQVILHTAMFPHGKSDSSWDQWSKAIKKINPKELQLYELEFEGSKFQPDVFFDFHELKRDILTLFRKNTFIPEFFFSSPFYVNVDLCSAVNSIIYLPLYIADYEKLFEEHGVKVNQMVSSDGDLGAADSILTGNAQFAICDPQAAVEAISSLPSDVEFDPKNEPKLVSVLINRLALWTLAEGDEQLPHNAIMQSDKIITYESGSTANYIWQWKKKYNSKNLKAKKFEAVEPGNEINAFCQSVKAGRSACVITADILGIKLCTMTCKEHKLASGSYADRKNRIGKNFLFTGLLASREVIEKYPGAVEGVISALQEAIRLFYDKNYMNKYRGKLTEYILNEYNTRKPFRPQKCSTDKLNSAIHSAIKEIELLKIYSTTGNVKTKELLNAFRVRFTSLKKMVSSSFFSVCYPMKIPLVNARSNIFFRFFGPVICFWSWILNSKPLHTFLFALLLLAISIVSFWQYSKKPPYYPNLTVSIAAVTASLSAATFGTFFVSIKRRKDGSL
ncbi:MAG: hypothetical protein FVQ82_08675 [Planctomycetes bacterium]|nr:hypothetical protein [Planctomycetota bacterium]